MMRPAAADVFSATFARFRTVDSSCACVAPSVARSVATVARAASMAVIASVAWEVPAVVVASLPAAKFALAGGYS